MLCIPTYIVLYTYFIMFRILHMFCALYIYYIYIYIWYSLFTIKDFLEVAIESWLDWNSNPRH